MRNRVSALVVEWKQEAIILQGKMECLHGQGMMLEAAAAAQQLEFFHELIGQLENTLKGRQGWCDQKGGERE